MNDQEIRDSIEESPSNIAKKEENLVKINSKILKNV